MGSLLWSTASPAVSETSRRSEDFAVNCEFASQRGDGRVGQCHSPFHSTRLMPACSTSLRNRFTASLTFSLSRSRNLTTKHLQSEFVKVVGEMGNARNIRVDHAGKITISNLFANTLDTNFFTHSLYGKWFSNFQNQQNRHF
jgi:hypothetical protein